MTFELDRRERIKSIVKSSKSDGGIEKFVFFFLNRNTFFSAQAHIYADKKNIQYNNKSPYGG